MKIGKVRFRQLVKLSVAIFLGVFAVSVIAGSVVVVQLYSQLSKPDAFEALQQKQNLDKVYSKIQVLDLAASNPIMAISASILITPGTYKDLSLAMSSGKEITGIAQEYLGQKKQRQDSLLSLAGPLDNAMPHVNQLFGALSRVHLGGVLSPWDKKIEPIRAKSKELLMASESLTPLVNVLPTLAGSEEPRKYLMAFQNSAEARGTGGILGAYAVIRTDKGKITFTDFGSNATLAQLQDIPIEMPGEYIRLYNDDPGIWQNSNLSPHFPYGARIWLALWERQYRERLDGVVTFDPIALSYLLQATGPVIANGEEINSENVVRVTLSDVYQRYKTNNEARKQFLINIIQAVSKVIEEEKISLTDVIQKLVLPVNEHRLLIYSDHVNEQKQIEKSSLSGSIEDKKDNVYRLVIQNTSGNKMDYYLERKLKIESLECLPKRKTRVTFTLKNNVDPSEKLPSYVKGRLDLNRPNGLKNSYGTRAIVLAPQEAYVLETKDQQTGKRFGFLARERGRIGIGVQVDLAAGESETYSITFSGGVGELKNHTQPLVNPQFTEVIDRCSAS
jgi:hypothetical protein